MTTSAQAAPASRLLTPTNHLLVLVDFQGQMAFATQSIDAVQLRNNVAIVSQAAAGFKVPTLLTTVAARSFSGPMFDEVTEAFPSHELLDRTTMNCWEDANVIQAVNASGHKRVVLAGLWTSVCIVGPALSAIEQGYEVLVLTDACGDITTEAHERAVARMVQVGVQPMTSLQYLLELQRDWGRAETYGLTTGIARKAAGNYGIGIGYAGAMFGASEG